MICHCALQCIALLFKLPDLRSWLISGNRFQLSSYRVSSAKGDQLNSSAQMRLELISWLSLAEVFKSAWTDSIYTYRQWYICQLVVRQRRRASVKKISKKKSTDKFRFFTKCDLCEISARRRTGSPAALPACSECGSELECISVCGARRITGLLARVPCVVWQSLMVSDRNGAAEVKYAT